MNVTGRANNPTNVALFSETAKSAPPLSSKNLFFDGIRQFFGRGVRAIGLAKKGNNFAPVGFGGRGAGLGGWALVLAERRGNRAEVGPGWPGLARLVGAGRGYRMLLSCSFIFSSSSFMPTTRCCTVASLALEPMVLISRPISWARKASFLPTASSGCRAASSK